MVSGNAGALVLKRGDNSYEAAGLNRVLAINNGEPLRFLMNDAPGQHDNNTGSLTVNYNCNVGTFGNAAIDVN